jgi:hypothetical protein
MSRQTGDRGRYKCYAIAPKRLLASGRFEILPYTDEMQLDIRALKYDSSVPTNTN